MRTFHTLHPTQTLISTIACTEFGAARRMAAVEKAEGQKVTLVKAAEADAEAKFLAGQGVARQRQAIINGLRESVLNFSHAVDGACCVESMLYAIQLMRAHPF